MLVLFSGADVYASTLIVAAFMAGLGVGHLVGGYAADRVSRRNALIGFAVAELCIGAFSLGSRALYYDFLYQSLGPRQIETPLLTLILFASLLWPTFFMGVSLPLLARAVTATLDRAAAQRGDALCRQHPRRGPRGFPRHMVDVCPRWAWSGASSSVR